MKLSQPDKTETAAFLLRFSLGIMFLTHSILLKLMTFGLHGTAQFFVGIGLPAWLAYVTFAMEVIGGAMLVLGIYTRYVSLVLILPLLGAIIWVHSPNGWLFTAQGGGWEYCAFLIMASIVQFLLGNGKYALQQRKVS
jgi:putative oxidoreductase